MGIWRNTQMTLMSQNTSLIPQITVLCKRWQILWLTFYQPNFPPIIINGSQIERAEKLSILGLSITRDLKWNEHVDKIVNEASKRIYLLKQLKRFGLDASDLKCFYVASIRSVYLNMHVRYSIMVYHKSVGCNRKDSKEIATYHLPSTILWGHS
jgi:hypothetical protein